MLFSLSRQFNIIIYSLLAGVITGVLFDLYRVFRGFECPNKIITFIEDTLFWVFTSIVVFIFLLITNYAYIRAYVYAAIGAGVFLYMIILSRTFIKVQYKFFRGIAKIFRVIFNFLFYPVKIVFYNIKRKNKQKILKKNLEENSNRT